MNDVVERARDSVGKVDSALKEMADEIARLWVALDRITDMEGQDEMTDHIFAEKALAIAHGARGSDSTRSEKG